MKDYIVFFTEGFDKYNIDKQIRAYPRAFVSTIDSAPEYDVLKEEARKAKDDGYDNFYMFWEKNSVHSVTEDMKSEFYEFHDTGALPYKYNKKLIEGDVYQNSVNNVNPTLPNQPVANVAQATANNPSQNNGITQQNQQNQQNQQYNELGSMNVSYSADHAASIFIWPINAYTSAASMQKALTQINREFEKDNMGRSPDNYKSTSTVYSTKKGPWATLIYVPSSLKELGQNFSNSAAMINEIANIYSNTDIFPSGHGFIRGNVMFAIEKEVFNKKEAKVTGGALDEMSFLSAIKKLEGSANKNNIAIFCTEPYKQYLSWCPKVVVVGDAMEPNLNANNLLKAAFDRIESYEKETVNSLNENPDNVNSEYLTRFDFNNTTVINKFNEVDKKYLKAFLSYYEWYLQHRNLDVYGNPNFNLKARASENEGSTEKFLKELDEFFKLGHMEDLQKIRKALGLKDKSFAGLLAPYKKFQKAKEVAESGKNAWDSRRKINWEKISNKMNSNKELSPEERAELEKILAEFDVKENAANQANNSNASVDNNDNSNTQVENAQKVGEGSSKGEEKKPISAPKEDDTPKGSNTSKEVKAEESISIDLVDMFMKKFYESDQTLGQSQNTNNAASDTNPTPNASNSNDTKSSGPLSEEDKTLIIRLYALTQGSGYKGGLLLGQALINFAGNIGKSWDKINELLVAIEEAKKPQVRQEALNEFNRSKEKQDIQSNVNQGSTANSAAENKSIKPTSEEKGKAKAEDLAEGPITETNPD